MCDSNTELRKVRSVPSIASFDAVPETKGFKFKIISGSEEVLFSYDLEQGKSLPYSTELEGDSEKQIASI